MRRFWRPIGAPPRAGCCAAALADLTPPETGSCGTRSPRTWASAGVFTSTGRDAWAVMGVSEAAVHSGAWRAGLPAAAAAAAALGAGGLAGLIVDYEPADNYTMGEVGQPPPHSPRSYSHAAPPIDRVSVAAHAALTKPPWLPPRDSHTAHAQAYGEFLGALATAAAPLKVGMDIAGWGVLKQEFWPAFTGRGLARFTSMTPTYDADRVTGREGGGVG
jgi:hypothetical protein